MSRPVVIVHGWSDRAENFERLGEFLRDHLSTSVTVIDLASWLSLNDEVTYNDLRGAFSEAWKEQPDLAGKTEVDVVTHSTGALLVRDWMTTVYRENRAACPIKRLVMLAPANFGSPLAHMGTSFLGRVFKGAATGGQVGTNILSGLELASKYTWDLAMRDVLTREPWYGKDGILATVLVGDTGYEGLQGIVNEAGSDGTVRVSTANLNVAHAVLSFDALGNPTFSADEPTPGQRTAFGVLGGVNHGSVTSPTAPTMSRLDPDDPNPRIPNRGETVGDWVLAALRVEPEGFDQLCADLEAATDRAYSASDSADGVYFHQFQNTVVQASDDHDNCVEEYLVDFHQKERGFGWLDLGFLFRQLYIYDVHNFRANPAYRSFYLDVTAILSPEPRDNQGLLLKVDPQPVCTDEQDGVPVDKPVGYPEGHEVEIDDTVLGALFRPNRTLLLEVKFTRKMVRRLVFDIQPLKTL